MMAKTSVSRRTMQPQMGSVIGLKRKRKRCLGEVPVQWHEEYAELQLEAKVDLICSPIPLGRLTHVYCWVLDGHSYRTLKLGPGSARAEVGNVAKAPCH